MLEWSLSIEETNFFQGCYYGKRYDQAIIPISQTYLPAGKSGVLTFFGLCDDRHKGKTTIDVLVYHSSKTNKISYEKQKPY